jgi:hypothetical protein
LNNDTRADASDVILHYGSSVSMRKAEDIITELGGGKRVNVYDNAQNVHTESITSSVMKIIYGVEEKLKCVVKPTFEFTVDNINILAKQMYRPKIRNDDNVWVDSDEKSVQEIDIERSLLRIELDRTIFKNVNLDLRSVLLLMYTYIQTCDDKDELNQRLLEELIDMAGTCSSGYISRLVNSLCGFGEFNIEISWADQIKANLQGRLNSKLVHEPPETRDKILDQMINIDIADRTAFLEFFIKHISGIKEDMYQEFSKHISDTDWDLYFMRAIIHYNAN